MKTGRNELCPCGSGLKFKKCCETKQNQLELGGARVVVPSTYQPLATHGYGPQQVEEMLRFAQRMRPAR